MEQESFLTALTDALGSQISTGERAAQAVHTALWNKACRNRPRALVDCLTVDNVQQVVKLATEHGVPISVLGGGVIGLDLRSCKGASFSIFARCRGFMSIEKAVR